MTSALRLTSRRRGGASKANSDPPEKMICPRHQENSSLARYAPTGPRFSGGGMEPRFNPPVSVVDPPGLVAGRGPGHPAGDHPGRGDRRKRIDGHTRGRRLPDLPRERCHRAFGAPIGPDVGRAPARARSDAQDLAVPGLRHDREGGAQDVEVAVEMDTQYGRPVLFGARREVGAPADAGDVHHGVERAELVDQPGEEGLDRLLVGHRSVRGPGRSSGIDDLLCRRLLRRRRCDSSRPRRRPDPASRRKRRHGPTLRRSRRRFRPLRRSRRQRAA